MVSMSAYKDMFQRTPTKIETMHAYVEVQLGITEIELICEYAFTHAHTNFITNKRVNGFVYKFVGVDGVIRC